MQRKQPGVCKYFENPEKGGDWDTVIRLKTHTLLRMHAFVISNAM